MAVVLLAGLTLVAFAANSLLCRMALGGQLIDPVSFTTVRLVSGAIALVPVARGTAGAEVGTGDTASWRSALALFAYALAFSLAYVWLTTGMGALILFGAVQVTMMSAAVRAGERPRPAQWLGLCLAAGGLVYLVLPGISAPDPLGAALMTLAGVAWGLYSIAGRGGRAPVAMTAGNFSRTVPLAVAASAVAHLVGSSPVRLAGAGAVLALVSGVVTSGLGYVLWYRTLPRLTTTQAAIVQLLVPVIAALGGVALLAEHLSARLVIASVLILGGVTAGVVVPVGSREASREAATT